MDNQDVCLRLDISPRTLQTLRDTGRLAFTQIQLYPSYCLGASFNLKHKKEQPTTPF